MIKKVDGQEKCPKCGEELELFFPSKMIPEEERSLLPDIKMCWKGDDHNGCGYNNFNELKLKEEMSYGN